MSAGSSPKFHRRDLTPQVRPWHRVVKGQIGYAQRVHVEGAEEIGEALTRALQDADPVPCAAEPEAWFEPTTAAVERSEEACLECRVMLLCGQYADAAKQQFGTWGGTYRGRQKDLDNDEERGKGGNSRMRPEHSLGVPITATRGQRAAEPDILPALLPAMQERRHGQALRPVPLGAASGATAAAASARPIDPHRHRR